MSDHTSAKKCSKRKHCKTSTNEDISNANKKVQLGSATDLEEDNRGTVAEATSKPAVGCTNIVIKVGVGSHNRSAIESVVRPAPHTFCITSMNPPFDEKLPVASLNTMIKELMAEKFAGKVYNVSEAGKWAAELSDSIDLKIRRDFFTPRYKYVFNVVLKQKGGADSNYSLRFTTNFKSGEKVSVTYDDGSFLCICNIFWDLLKLNVH